jgi:hypothetical protein
MSLSANKARLGEMTKDLLARWEETHEQWRDTKAADFEGKYLRELKSDVDKAMAAMNELEKVLAKMRKDCE